MAVQALAKIHLVRLMLALELVFALLALLVLGRGLLLGSRDSACLQAALALVLQGARLAGQRLIGGSPSCACQAAQAQDDGQRLEAAGRCERVRDGRGEVCWDSCTSALASDAARGADPDERERLRCMLCGQDGPVTRQASAASSRCSSAGSPCSSAGSSSAATDDGFRPCVLCGGARESQRAAARAHEVRALWRLPQSPVQCALTELQAVSQAGPAFACASSPCPRMPPPPAGPAEYAARGRDVQDAHRRKATYSDQADARQASRLEAANGTRTMMAAMVARREANAASAKPPQPCNLPRHNV
jgi:hypothetical protein